MWIGTQALTENNPTENKATQMVIWKHIEEVSWWMAGVFHPQTGCLCFIHQSQYWCLCSKGNKFLCYNFSFLIILVQTYPVPFIPLAPSTLQTTNELAFLTLQLCRRHPTHFHSEMLHVWQHKPLKSSHECLKTYFIIWELPSWSLSSQKNLGH